MPLSAKKPNETFSEIDPMIDPVQQFLKGNARAFDEIRKHLEPLIQSVIGPRKRYFYLDQVDDVRQDCWIEVIQKLKYWDPARGSLKSFMYKCVQNCVTNYFRRSRYFARFAPSEIMEDRLSSECDDAPNLSELELEITGRINTHVARYIMNRVVVATYLKVFEKSRGRIVAEVVRVGVISSREAIFLVNQAVVTLRWHCLNKQKWEHLCKIPLQNVV